MWHHIEMFLGCMLQTTALFIVGFVGITVLKAGKIINDRTSHFLNPSVSLEDCTRILGACIGKAMASESLNLKKIKKHKREARRIIVPKHGHSCIATMLRGIELADKYDRDWQSLFTEGNFKSPVKFLRCIAVFKQAMQRFYPKGLRQYNDAVNCFCLDGNLAHVVKAFSAWQVVSAAKMQAPLQANTVIILSIGFKPEIEQIWQKACASPQNETVFIVVLSPTPWTAKFLHPEFGAPNRSCVDADLGEDVHLWHFTAAKESKEDEKKAVD